MLSLTRNQWAILERLENGARWARTFQSSKHLVADLIVQGFVERCRPYLGRGANMVQLTDAGCDLLRMKPENRPRDPDMAAPKTYTRRKRYQPYIPRDQRNIPVRVLPPIVDRDPCPRCGVRGDIDCGHSRARLGVML